MAAQFTRADSLREYLTGSTTDGGSQYDPNASLGGHRSIAEALSLGISIINPISGASVLYAGGANPAGAGILSAVDATHLTWQPNGASIPGPPAAFSGANDTEIVEAANAPGQYLRITGTTPFVSGQSTITLAYLADNVYGFDDLSFAQAAAGLTEYRATIVRNESQAFISGFQRYIATLGVPQVSNGSQLGASGAGSIITTGSFATWPTAGWCQIRTSAGALREVVYYSSRTLTTLTVPTTGRGVFNTSLSAGANTDIVNPVPSIIIGIDPAGVQNFGQPIQVVGNTQTAPTGVTWNFGLTGPTGLQLGSLAPGQQIGIWMQRAVPGGAVSSPSVFDQVLDNFNTF